MLVQTFWALIICMQLNLRNMSGLHVFPVLPPHSNLPSHFSFALPVGANMDKTLATVPSSPITFRTCPMSEKSCFIQNR